MVEIHKYQTYFEHIYQKTSTVTYGLNVYILIINDKHKIEMVYIHKYLIHKNKDSIGHNYILLNEICQP